MRQMKNIHNLTFLIFFLILHKHKSKQEKVYAEYLYVKTHIIFF